MLQISDKRHFSRIRRLERMMLHGKDVSAENIQNKTANRVLKSWSLNTISYEFSKFTTIFHQQELNSFSSHFMFLNKINLKHQVSIRWQIEHFLWGRGVWWGSHEKCKFRDCINSAKSAWDIANLPNLWPRWANSRFAIHLEFWICKKNTI